MNAFEVDLPGETRRCLNALAQAGLLGSTAENVAAYLIIRGIDDLTRSGVLRLESSEVKAA